MPNIVEYCPIYANFVQYCPILFDIAQVTISAHYYQSYDMHILSNIVKYILISEGID